MCDSLQYQKWLQYILLTGLPTNIYMFTDLDYRDNVFVIIAQRFSYLHFRGKVETQKEAHNQQRGRP
jgi:hypothetical protein